MFKIIVVDDDEVMLNNIMGIVDWKRFGYELVGRFADAESAVEFINKNKVDAIISDIKMPGMNGIELAGYVAEHFPSIVIALLSGYESFEYAREALRNNVVDYILKPMPISEIERVLEKMSGIIKERVSDLSESGSEEIELQMFVTEFIGNKTDDISFIEKVFKNKNYKHGIKSTPVMIAEVDILSPVEEYLREYWRYGRNRLNDAINNLILSENIIAVPIGSYFDRVDYFIIFDCNDVKNCRECLASMAAEVRKNAREMLKLDLEVREKRIADNIFEIRKDSGNDFLSINADLICRYTKSGDAEKASAFYREFKEKVNGENAEIKKLLNMLLLRFREDENYTYYSDASKKLIERAAMAEEWNAGAETERLIVHIAEDADMLNGGDYVKCAKEYIDGHYAEKIRLSDCARYVCLSESWLGKLFKKDTGKNFTEYLNDVRIDKAVGLLRHTNHSVYTIAEKVGYKSYNHFYLTFKGAMGCSPKEYRDSLRNGN